ncbi:hypothetical protein Ahy_A07g036569 [Arachis hypogaea]|uniref:Transposase MuDR plant domain-containing protein n=1 Tax=Arachis hypogaea TaxID=3818 RepID=A0A445CGI3_ARAHY|nr:hypothetical protein Ahy_A07g036569 [Arachis hypogaea]
MSMNPLLSIHYDGEIVYDEEVSIVFKSGPLIVTYMTSEVNNLTTLKDLILHFVRYRLRDDEDVRLIRSWHNRWANVHLLKLFVFLVELGGRGSSAILSMIVQDNAESHEGSTIRDPTMDQYEVNPDDGDDADYKPTEIPDDGDEEEEMNYYGDTKIVLAQLAVSRLYDRSDHFSKLNLDAMTSDWSFTQGGPDQDPSNKFEDGQQFENKEEVMLAVKRYNINRAVEYKILESDQLSVRVLQGGEENHFGYKTSYRKFWLVKQRVFARIYGDWEESYNELPRWLFAMQMYLPSTWVQLVTQPWPGSSTL